jgi:hypothetical protein
MSRSGGAGQMVSADAGLHAKQPSSRTAFFVVCQIKRSTVRKNDCLRRGAANSRVEAEAHKPTRR